MYQATIYEVDLKISTVSVGRDEEEGGGGLSKFFDIPRQNYTISVEFGMLRSFNIKYELLHYITSFAATCKSETVYDVLKSELHKKKHKLTYMKFEVRNIEIKGQK